MTTGNITQLKKDRDNTFRMLRVTYNLQYAGGIVTFCSLMLWLFFKVLGNTGTVLTCTIALTSAFSGALLICCATVLQDVLTHNLRAIYYQLSNKLRELEKLK